MKPAPSQSAAPDEERDAIAIRVADTLADAVARGPYAAMRTARNLSEEELRLGLDFVSTVLEVASSSARAMAAVLAERTGRESSRPIVH
jgi:ribosomal protein S11